VGGDSSPALFVSHGAYRERALTTQSIWQIVNRAAKAIFGTNAKGQPLKRVGPHAFRHLRAQHLSDEGMPITSLQALLGHASIATTRDIYAPKTPADKLTEEVGTYGRDPDDVIARANEALKRGT
jgi:site-specific recombinase XerD